MLVYRIKVKNVIEVIYENSYFKYSKYANI